MNDNKPSDWVEDDDNEAGTDTALEMLGGLLAAVLAIAFSLGVYFIVTRW